MNSKEELINSENNETNSSSKEELVNSENNETNSSSKEELVNSENNETNSSSKEELVNSENINEIQENYNFGWSRYSEITNGRFAMIGFLAIILIELFSEKSFLKWVGIL